MLVCYINDTFLVREAKYNAAHERISPEASEIYLYIIFVCLIYPVAYDGTQMAKQKVDYLNDPWNYIDILHIFMGFAILNK